MKLTHLCGRTEAEDNAKDQVGVSCSDEHQVSQSPGQTQ